MSAPANLRERSSGAEEQPSGAVRRGAAGGGEAGRGGRAPLRHQLEVGARLRARELQRGTRQLPARGKAAAGQPMRVGRAERAAGGAAAAAAHSVSPAGGSVTRVELMPLSMRAPRSCVDIACGRRSLERRNDQQRTELHAAPAVPGLPVDSVDSQFCGSWADHGAILGG